MNNKILAAPQPNSLVRVWRSTGDPGTPLVCIWVQAECTRLRPILADSSSDETGGRYAYAPDGIRGPDRDLSGKRRQPSARIPSMKPGSASVLASTREAKRPPSSSNRQNGEKHGRNQYASFCHSLAARHCDGRDSWVGTAMAAAHGWNRDERPRRSDRVCHVHTLR
jgi:hypothetical protein